MPEKDLNRLLSGLTPKLDLTPYVFLCFDGEATAGAAPLPDNVKPLMEFREEEGLTLICTTEDAKKIAQAARLPEPAGSPPEPKEELYARITLQVYSDLTAVGLTAAVSETLTKHNIPANVVAAYHHDHVFVPYDKAGDAMEALKELSSSSATEEAQKK